MSASGIGDARPEGLYRFIKESEGSPSIAANIGLKFATGKNKDLESDELPTGTGSTDYCLSVIFGKKLGPIAGKALLGYSVIGEGVSEWWLGPDNNVDPGEQLLFSLSGAYPVNESFEVGGELWGNSCGPEIISGSGWEFQMPKSERLQIYFSPYLAFMPSPGVSLRAAIDYPISVPAAFDYENSPMGWFKGMTLSVGGSITI